MPEFASRHAYQAFADFVKNRARHILDPAGRSFVDAVLATSERRTTFLAKGCLVWRSQLGHNGCKTITDEDRDEEIPEPYEPERMVPRPNRACEGRVNAKGIPCLYCADLPPINSTNHN